MRCDRFPRLTVEQLEQIAPPVPAAEALRRNLVYQLMLALSQADVDEVRRVRDASARPDRVPPPELTAGGFAADVARRLITDAIAGDLGSADLILSYVDAGFAPRRIT